MPSFLESGAGMDCSCRLTSLLRSRRSHQRPNGMQDFRLAFLGKPFHLNSPAWGFCFSRRPQKIVRALFS